MKVLFAGTPGVRKAVALENLRLAVQRLFPRERILTQKSPDQADRIPLLDHALYGTNPIPFLGQSQDNQKSQWRETFAAIRKEFRKAQTENHFLGIHLTYRYQQIPSCILDFQDLVKWHPDCIVTFIDDAYCVRERIHKGGYKSFTLSELVLWRAEEILVGDLLARTISPTKPPPNYVIAVKHPSELLARLLFQDHIARVYTSFNISDVKKKADLREVIDNFRKTIHAQKGCVAFDPLTIDELPLLYQIPRFRRNTRVPYDASNPTHRWPVLDQGSILASDEDLSPEYPIRIPLRELKDARNAIDAQVRNRDIRLVDQAHFLVVYRPTLSGKAELSTGVHTEVERALTTGRPIIWYIRKGDDPIPTSPFVPKNPADNPDFFYEKNDQRFWQRISRLHESLNEDRDHFLR